MTATKIDTGRYNGLGQYVLRERGDLSMADIAIRGGISAVRLGRWLRADLRRMPPTDVLQAIATGLHRPLFVVQQAAAQAAGQVTPGALSDEQQTVVAAMSEVSATWQKMIVDVVLRVTGEVLFADGPQE